MKNIIISGITGQDAAYLSKILLDKEGYRIVGLVRDRDNINKTKLEYLNIEKRISFEQCNLESFEEVVNIINKYNPVVFYNMASQSSVGLSYKKPKQTLAYNINSVVNILEAIRVYNPKIKFFQASSGEIFGMPKTLPVTEDNKINPVNPYGISKAATSMIIKNYRSLYNIFASSAIFFNHESVLRGENFVLKKIVRESVKISNGLAKELRVGNIDVKRDFGYAPKYMEAVYKMMKHEKADDYILASGKSIVIKEVIEYVFKKLSISMDKLTIDKELYREEDTMDIYGSNEKVKKELNWEYDLDFFTVIDEMIRFEQEKLGEI